MSICATVACGRRGALGSLDRRTTLAPDTAAHGCGSAISATLVIAFYNKHNRLRNDQPRRLMNFVSETNRAGDSQWLAVQVALVIERQLD